MFDRKIHTTCDRSKATKVHNAVGILFSRREVLIGEVTLSTGQDSARWTLKKRSPASSERK